MSADTMIRFFCVNTTINPKEHFYVDPSRWNDEHVLSRLLRGEWLTLLAPSQSGKSTRAQALVLSIEKAGHIPVLFVPPLLCSSSYDGVFFL